ncbi:hypothetical protein T265_10276 [Opisthorchis viverrini]|uniref:U6 snRNA-associated Sm-like protein LSm1 n=1 Tax=Opisthorchis viverrini TaxID=6198 RepID=A0A074Z2V9_OPIVI|nr:hypothetical protein T265_10276 [Opisthorchis viverrini]KER21406.1 hypothetical protein T265_10276 [Opisthorchis viverrini]
MHQRNYPGSASLFHDLGKKMMVCLHGGRVYFGFLRIIDQFGNVVLHQAFERIHVDKKFCDIPQGILMIRGENIILIGEVDENCNIEEQLELVSEKEIYALQAERTAARKALSKRRAQLFAARGLGLPDPSDLLCNTLPVSSCHATRGTHEGWDTARLPKPRQGNSRGRDQRPPVSKFALQPLDHPVPLSHLALKDSANRIKFKKSETTGGLSKSCRQTYM